MAILEIRSLTHRFGNSQTTLLAAFPTRSRSADDTRWVLSRRMTEIKVR